MPSNAQRAQAAGTVRYGGREAELKNSRQLLDQQVQRDLNMLQQWGTTGNQAIDDVYSAVVGDLEANRARARDIVGTQVARTGQGYENAAAANLAVRDEGRNYLKDLVELQGGDQAQLQALTQASSPLEQLAGNLTERNRRFGQDMQAILRNFGAEHDVLYGEGIDQANLERAQAVKNFQDLIAGQMGQVQTTGLEGQLTLGSQLASLLGERGAFEVDYAGELADKDAAMALEQARLQMQANELAQRMALEKAKLADQRAYRQAQLNEAAAARAAAGDDTAWEREKFYAGLGLDYDKLRASQGQDAWQRSFAERELGMKYPGEPYSGRTGLAAWASEDPSNRIAAKAAESALNKALASDAVFSGADPHVVASRMLRGLSRGAGALGVGFDRNRAQTALDIATGYYR